MKSGTGLPVVEVVLEHYWHETILRDEAKRRLANRPMSETRRASIVEQLPSRAEHYITFNDGAFREYVQLGDQPALVLMMLPCKRTKAGSFMIVTPFFNSDRYPDGRTRSSSGISVHEFRTAGSQLELNGLARPTFKFHGPAMRLAVDASILSPSPSEVRKSGGHPGGTTCCNLCEWVHSVLDYHEFDWACCNDSNGSTCEWGYPGY